MTEQRTEQRTSRIPWFWHFTAIVGLALVTLWVFRFLFGLDEGQVISILEGDLNTEYFAWREFGFAALKQGHLALWNPHLFAGSPFLANPETALLYPFNWLHLFLPVGLAINITVALHIFLAGLTFYLWMAFRRFHPGAGFVAAVCFMLSGPVFSHVWPGHLSNLGSMAWAPLLFLAIDGLFTEQCWRYCLVGVVAIALQILAGHIQYVYFTGLIASLYFGLKLISASARLQPLLGFGLMYVWAAAIAAVQLLTTASNATTDGARAAAFTFKDGTLFSFPPENFLTLLMPGLFGQMGGESYWGRCFYWEMCLFLTVTGLIIAIQGAQVLSRAHRRIALICIGSCLALALGKRSPVFVWAFSWVPLLNHFRGPSKFTFQASLFFALLIGAGFDDLIRRPLERRKLAFFSLGLAILLFSLAGSIWWMDHTGHWAEVIRPILFSSESYISRARAHSLEILATSADFALHQTIQAGAILLFLAAALLLIPLGRIVVGFIGALAVAEAILFAGQFTPSFEPVSPVDRDIAWAIQKNPGDYRVLWDGTANTTMSLGLNATYGYSSIPPQRIESYIRAAVQYQTHQIGENFFDGPRANYFSLTRTKFAISAKPNGLPRLMVNTVELPQFLLVPQWKVVPNFLAAQAEITKPDFNPRETVFLESQPGLMITAKDKAATSAPVKVRLENQSDDSMEMSFDAKTSGLLLMTDAYDSGWKADALPDSIQSNYQVMPADSVIRAIAVQPGHHHLKLEYRPSAFIMGKYISLSALALFAAAVGIELFAALILVMTEKFKARSLVRWPKWGEANATGNH